MPVLRNVGDTQYTGWDLDAGQSVSAEPGATMVVSDAKAEQLERDFPGCWARATDHAADRLSEPPQEAEAVPEATKPRARPPRDKLAPPSRAKGR